MKAFKILVAALMFVSVSVYAADKQPSKAPVVPKNQQSETANAKNPNYTWQDCVRDMENESGYSQEDAYKQCEGLK